MAEEPKVPMYKSSGFWLRFVAVPGAVLSIIGIWNVLDIPTPAWSTDIRALNQQQADIAVEVYRSKVRSLLTVKPPEEEPARSLWLEDLEQAKRDRDKAEQRQIELSK